jgi:hypothetical protein
MSNEAIWKTSTQVAAVTGTANIAVAGFNAAAEASVLTSTDTANYPLADASLFASFSTSVSSASNYINLYRRDMNIDGTNDGPQPQSAAPAYSNTYVGKFTVPPYTAASSGYFPLKDIPLSGDCQFFTENKTNATIIGTGGSTYVLKITPKTYAPAA